MAPIKKIGEDDLDYIGICELQQPQYHELLDGLIGSTDVFTKDALVPLRSLKLRRPGKDDMAHLAWLRPIVNP